MQEQRSLLEVNKISSTCHGDAAPEQGPSLGSEERGGSLQIPPRWVQQPNG